MKRVKNITCFILIICMVLTATGFPTTAFAEQVNGSAVDGTVEVSGDTSTSSGALNSSGTAESEDTQTVDTTKEAVISTDPAVTNIPTESIVETPAAIMEIDEASPALSSAFINGVILTLDFDEELDTGKIPSLSDFTVKITDTDRDETVDTDLEESVYEISVDTADIVSMDAIDTVSLDAINTVSTDTLSTDAADNVNVIDISVFGNKTILTLADPVSTSAAVLLDYNPSEDSERLQDISGNTVDDISDYQVSNITGEKGLPDFVVEKIYNMIDMSSLSDELAHQVYYAMLVYRGSKSELEDATSEIVDILQTTETFSGLTAENKFKLCSFFGINHAFFAYSEGKGENLEQAILTYSKMTSLGLVKEEINQAIQNDTRDEVISEYEQEPQQAQGMLMETALTDTDPFAGVKYDKEKTLNAPFQHTSSANEQVDLSSGTLDYNVTDVVLPGKDGLDIVLERQYSTEQANYYDVSGKLQYVDWDTGRTLNSYMQVDEKEKHFAKNADGTMGDYTDSTSYDYVEDDFIESDAFRGLYNAKEIDDDGSYFSAHLYNKTMTTDTYGISAYQVSNPITRNDELWQLGTGWKFNFSYIDIDSFYFDYKKLHLSDGREFGVSSNWVNNLGHYTYKDVIFATEAVAVAGQTSTYSVTYSDGKKEYFNSDGRLIAIVDRFGNTISFTYATVNNKLEMTITDTLGRIITLTNQATSTGYNKVLTLPDGKTITYTITQNTGRTINEFDDLEDFPGQFNEYNLTKIINQAGEETSYSYTDIECDDDFAARFSQVDGDIMHATADGEYYYWNYYAGLSKITYPTGLTVNYEYYTRRNAWYDYGCTDDIVMKKRYDQQGTTLYNVKEYDYYNHYVKDGVQVDTIYNADDYNNENWQSWWTSEKDTGRNATAKYYFDYSHGNCVSENVYLGTDLVQATSNEYRTFNKVIHPSKTKITTVKYDTSDDQPLTTIECYEYDNKGNAISYWTALAEGNTADMEHKVSMVYQGTYNYLTSTTYKRDSATTINEQNVPSSDGKTVAQSLTYENDVLKAKSEFGYDVYGNVTETKVYTDINAGTYIDTINTYQSGTYLTGAAVQNVKDADGTNIGNVTRQATYDIYGRILTETDGKGYVTSYAYDNIGRLTRITYPGNITKIIAYNTPSNQTTVTDERGYVTRYQYDGAGNLINVCSMDGEVATVMKANEYDSSYRLVKEQNNLSVGGGSIAYSYDYKDRVTQKISKNAINQVLAQENITYYDDKMTKTVVGDTQSEPIVTTEYTDKYGRKTKQGRFIDGVEVFNTFDYNHLGEVVKEKTARANAEGFTEEYTSKYDYDFAGNVKKQYDVLGNYITNGYDAAGFKISVTDAKSTASGGTYRSVYTYDALGRLVKEEIPYTAGTTAVTKYYYDANGNPIQKLIKNSLPGATEAYTKIEYVYNDKNQLTQIKSYDGSTVANQVDYEYDAAGNMTAMITGGGTERTGYGYDRYGNLVTLTDALGQVETYVYNINGNLTDKTDKNGLTTDYTYDGLARKLSQHTVIDGVTQAETFGYTATGTLAFAQNANIRTDYTYDELGRLVKELDSKGVEKDYTYDVNGNLKTSVVKVNGTPVKSMSFVYDKKDRLYQAYEAGILVATYSYDANGNRSTLTYGNGDSAEYAYNLANLVTSLQNKKGTTALSNYTYTFYLDGNQATKTDNTGRLTNYSYDGLGRLKQEAESGATDAITKAYTFDPAGNRATMTVSGAEVYTAGYVYDLNNRLTAETKTAGTSTNITDYYYDKNGNTIAKRTGILTASSGTETPALSVDMTGTELYSYDGYDRMIGAQNASGLSIYTYKPDGLRLSKTVNGVTTTHVWEGQNITLELTGSGAVSNRYIRGIGLIKSDNNGWYLFNGHGDVVQLADGIGTVTKTYAYDAFGNEKGIVANDTNPFRYSAEYYDKESGTIYLRARYYEPSIGRFLSEDSYTGKATDPLSLNLYTYCYSNPVRHIDPSGNVVETVIDIASIGWSAYDLWKNPSLVNAGFLAWDVGAALVPFAPGSYVAKGGKLLMHADDYVKTGVWAMKAFDRGYAIERYLGGWCNNFPVIDKFTKGSEGIAQSITSIKSMDVTANTYQNGSKLYNKLMGYTKDLAGFQGKRQGGINVVVNDDTNRILELALPPVELSKTQADQLQRAINEAKAKYDIDIVVKIVTQID